jgi:hypothetical protein
MWAASKHGVSRYGADGQNNSQAQTAQCPFSPERPKEAIHPDLLACSAFADEQAAMWVVVGQKVGGPTVSAAQALPADQHLAAALLGDALWGMLRLWMVLSSGNWLSRCCGCAEWFGW